MRPANLACAFYTGLAATIFFATVGHADFRISGNLVYLDEGVEVEPPMPVQKAQRYLRYRHQSAQAGSSIRDAPPRTSLLRLEEPSPGEHFYTLQFSEEDEEVAVDVEFKSVNFFGHASDNIPKFAYFLLHVPVSRQANYQSALEKAVLTIEKPGTAAEILDAFDVLSIELTQEPVYKYRGMKIIGELIGQYASTAPGVGLPKQFSQYLDSLAELAPLGAFPVTRRFQLYKSFGFTLADQYDLRQPIGGGRAVHDIASKLLGEALTLAFAGDEAASIERPLVANTVLRKVKVECEEMLLPARCAETVRSYFSAYPTFAPADLLSFLSTLGTALEHESNIPNPADVDEEGKAARIREDSYLRALWSEYFCIAGLVIATLEKADLSDDAKRYVMTLFHFSKRVATEGGCDAASS